MLRSTNTAMNKIVFVAILNLSYLFLTCRANTGLQDFPVPPCQAELIKYLDLKNKGLLPRGATEPICDSNGYYAPKQCSGSQCYCVTRDGRKIQGYTANLWNSSGQTCQCARDEDEYRATGLIGKWFLCTSDGSYEKVQCSGSVCYCADAFGHWIGPSVNISQANSLIC